MEAQAALRKELKAARETADASRRHNAEEIDNYRSKLVRTERQLARAESNLMGQAEAYTITAGRDVWWNFADKSVQTEQTAIELLLLPPSPKNQMAEISLDETESLRAELATRTDQLATLEHQCAEYSALQATEANATNACECDKYKQELDSAVEKAVVLQREFAVLKSITDEQSRNSSLTLLRPSKPSRASSRP